MTRVVAIVDDLMDRSRITAVASDTTAVAVSDDVRGADVVVLDLGRHADEVARVRERAPDAFVVAFGRHDDTTALMQARRAGADRVLTRARFFADVADAISLPTGR